MTAIAPFQLTATASGEYYCSVVLNLYDSEACETLATQADLGQQLKILQIDSTAALIQLSEDGYQAWLPLTDLVTLIPAPNVYQAVPVYRTEIETKIPSIIAYLQAAKSQSNYYLWGGNIGPNYDCSGLIQAAFRTSGISLPRDSYQQEAFSQRVEIADLLPGDLIFFGDKKVDHVALYLGKNQYIHSSGIKMGRNGIGIDLLSDQGDAISQGYFRKWWSCGRVMHSYNPVAA